MRILDILKPNLCIIFVKTFKKYRQFVDLFSVGDENLSDGKFTQTNKILFQQMLTYDDLKFCWSSVSLSVFDGNGAKPWFLYILNLIKLQSWMQQLNKANTYQLKLQILSLLTL